MEDQSMLSIKIDSKVKKAVLELQKINSEFKRYEEAYKFKKEELSGIIKKYTSDKNIDEFKVTTKDFIFKVRPVVNRKIIWDFDKLGKKVKKSLLKQFVKKEYYIEDYDGLVEYLKSCGVNPKTFRQYLKIDKKVDTKVLDQLYELGEIEYEEISDCYKVEITSGYIKISELEN